MSWALGEPIEITATLAYIGAAPLMTVIGSGGGIVHFGIEQLDGPFAMGPLVIGSAQGYDFSTGDVMTVPYVKSGAYDADRLTALFWGLWFDDPELRLTPGTYRIYAVADYDVPDVPITDGLRAAVVVEVAGLPAPDPSVAPGPSGPETSATPASPTAPVTSTDDPFPWPTLPPPRQVPVPARFEPKGRPDATTTGTASGWSCGSPRRRSHPARGCRPWSGRRTCGTMPRGPGRADAGPRGRA